MSWVDWFKALADRRPGGATAAAAKAPSRRTPRKGGDAYAKEWVNVLEESAPDHDPFNTYTWDLNPDATAVNPRVEAPAAKRANGPPTDPFDSFTWEVPETDSRDDPWGLKKDAAEAAKAAVRKDGINPYDTGVFEASWTGRFDQR